MGRRNCDMRIANRHLVRVAPTQLKRSRDMATNPETYGAMPATGYLRQSQLIPAIFPFSSATLWRMVKAGTFPQPVKLGPRITAWRVEDIRGLLAGHQSSSARVTPTSKFARNAP